MTEWLLRRWIGWSTHGRRREAARRAHGCRRSLSHFRSRLPAHGGALAWRKLRQPRHARVFLPWANRRDVSGAAGVVLEEASVGRRRRRLKSSSPPARRREMWPRSSASSASATAKSSTIGGGQVRWAVPRPFTTSHARGDPPPARRARSRARQRDRTERGPGRCRCDARTSSRTR